MNKDQILELADKYAHEVYKLAKTFPKEEVFGITSQLRRAALSVPLNLIEGHSRSTDKNRLNFARMAFGSLKEAQYCIKFAHEEGYCSDQEANAIHTVGDQLSAMLWKKLKTLESKLP